MIADDCGYNQIAAADYYQNGVLGRQVYDRFPVKVAMSTYSIDDSYNPGQAWSDFDYVKSNYTDSAAAATAMSIGVKTYDAAIGVDDKQAPLVHLTEYFEALGRSTGVVSTMHFSHATPAGFVAHNPQRYQYSAIAQEMLMSSQTDVIMGAGHPLFDNNGQPAASPDYSFVGGEATWNDLVDGTLTVADADGDQNPDAWQLIQTKNDFTRLARTARPASRVLGVAQVSSTLQQGRGGDSKAAPFVVPLTPGLPDLALMARGALNVLDENRKGFFLMIEGGAVDYAAHSNESGRMIEEKIAFNQAVAAVVQWVETKSSWRETLLIVTGDHETGYLTGPGSGPGVEPGSGPVWNRIINNGRGKLPGMQWHLSSHSNSLIPLFAKGNGANLFYSYADEYDPVRGRYIDNIEIAKLIATLLP